MSNVNVHKILNKIEKSRNVELKSYLFFAANTSLTVLLNKDYSGNHKKKKKKYTNCYAPATSQCSFNQLRDQRTTVHRD